MAFQNLNLSWEQIKGKGILKIYKGNKTHEHLMPLFRLRRIFANKIVMLHWAKNLEQLLDWDINKPKDKTNASTHKSKEKKES